MQRFRALRRALRSCRSLPRSAARCCFDGRHPSYAGDLGLGVNPKLAGAHQGLPIWCCWSAGACREMPRQSYTLLDIPAPRQKLVHVHPDPERTRPRLPPASRHQRVAGCVRRGARRRCSRRRGRLARRTEHGARRLSGLERPGADPPSRRAPDGRGDGASARDACRPTRSSATAPATSPTWVHRFWPLHDASARSSRRHRGSMGYGVPAAVGAKRVSPDRTVVAFAGDGDFLMNGQEFATAVQYDLPIIVILLDNGMYGTIRMHQEREYPGRVSATHPEEPGFRRLRQSLRRPWRARRADRGVRAGARARARVGQARDPALPARSGGDHAGDDADADPREGAGREVANRVQAHPRHARACPWYPRLFQRRDDVDGRVKPGHDGEVDR